MRLDLLLVRLRFCRSRSLAQALVSTATLRRNGARVVDCATRIKVGDVLTIPLGKSVQIIKLAALPERRGPPVEAQACYQRLDAGASLAIAESQGVAPVAVNEGNSTL